MKTKTARFEKKKGKKPYMRTDSSVMLDQFIPNWSPTLEWALTGFTGLAFCQRSEVKSREGGGGGIT